MIPENRIGSVAITDVVNVATSPAKDGHTQVVFSRTGDDPPPKIKVPLTARIVAWGEDLGEQRICCESRHNVPGGFVSVRFE